jgi:hypothetical protein
MRLSKKLTFGCLILSFALFFGSCSFFSELGANEPSSNKTEPKKSNLDELKTSQTDKTKEIAELKDGIKELEEKRVPLAKEILSADKNPTLDKATLAEIEKKCGTKKKTPQNELEVGVTPPKCNDFKSVQDKLDEKNKNLTNAESELKNLEHQIRNSPRTEENTKTGDSGFGDLLPWFALGFAGIAGLGLLGGLYFLLNRKIEREREASIVSFNAVRSEQKELSRQIKQLGETAKLQNVRVERQQSAILSLQKQSSEAGNIGYAAQPQQFYEQSPVNKPEPQFPVSAEDYLNKVRHHGQKASADLIGGMLVQDPNKNEEFLIVKDNALADGLFYAVPSFNRFSTRSDYLTYYQNYYACENPSGGTVWILAPTTVRRVEGGWKLEEMGELEIRN